MASNTELRDTAVTNLKQTTTTYLTWKSRVDSGRYKDPANSTAWGRAFAALDLIADAPIPTPTPTPPPPEPSPSPSPTPTPPPPSTGVTPSPMAVLMVPRLDDGQCGGYIASGVYQYSNTNLPRFVMEGESQGAVYDFYVDNIKVGTATAIINAKACFSVPQPLADGLHVIQAKGVTPGRENNSVAVTFLIDTVAPAPPSAPTLATWSDTGKVGDNITSVRSPAFLGKAEPGIQIMLYEGPRQVGGALADTNGNWQISTSSLTDGTHTFVARTRDRAGNQSVDSPSVTITVTPTPPS